MKNFLFACATLLAFTATAQQRRVDLKDYKGNILEYGREATLKTTDSTLQTLDVVPVAADEVGIIRVTIVGANFDATAGITGVKIFRYKKVAGTLTIGSATDILATATDTELTGSTSWSIVSASNNIAIKVKGKLPLTSGIKWKSRVEYLSRRPG